MNYEKYYKPEDKYTIINDGDSILRPVVLRLPKAPPMHLIDGYGLKPEDQYFRKHGVPLKLKKLENRAHNELEKKKNTRNIITGYKLLKRYWELFNEEKDNLKEEVKYIKKVWYHLKYGYWFFNDGQPTWITPWHYKFLNFWYIKDVPGLTPEYRDRDRRRELYEWYNYTSRETFKDLDEKGRALKNKDGKYEMVELKNRTSFGTQELKRRRCGATHGCLDREDWIAMMKKGGYNTIIADIGRNAKDIFRDYFLFGWRNKPMFLKPIWSGDNNPASGVEHITPSNIYNEKSIGSTVTYTESADERANDGKKIAYILCDEEGKTEEADVYTRWRINQKTMHQGYAIHGYSNHPSTVEEMHEGGAAYETIWKHSNFYIREPVSGWTISGLRRYFFKTEDGYDGYIDRWGKSVIDTPTERQIEFAPPNANYVEKRKGAREVIEEKRSFVLREEGQEGWRSLIRKEPQDSTECFIGTAGSIGFNLVLLDKRITELNYREETVTGNLVETGEKVVWVDNPSGKFACSWVLKPAEMEIYQQKVLKYEWNADKNKRVPSWAPKYPNLFIAGADPYDFMNKTEAQMEEHKSRLSDGGGAVFWKRDKTLDPKDEDLLKWLSNRFILTYRNRKPGVEEYCKDMLLMCRYCGAMMYFERNKTWLWKYFLDEGYGGFLLYGMDRNGRRNTEPGFYSIGAIKEQLLLNVKEYIDNHGHREKHKLFLEECKAIRGPEMLKKYDLLTACGAALLGETQIYPALLEKSSSSQQINVADYGFAPHDY
jgi:hypothetical protein